MFFYNEQILSKLYGSIDKELLDGARSESCISQCTGCMCSCKCSCSGGKSEEWQWEVN